MLKTKEELEKTQPEFYEKLRSCTVKVETAKIPDFIPLIREGMDLRTSHHTVIHTHPFTGKEILFLSNPSHEILEADAPIALQKLIDFAVECGVYTH